MRMTTALGLTHRSVQTYTGMLVNTPFSMSLAFFPHIKSVLDHCKVTF